MRRPFVLRVQNDDPAIARAIARALVTPLRERGGRVQEGDGAADAGAARFRAQLQVGTRGLPGTSIAIGVADEEFGARWLAPIDAPSDPALAVECVLDFLEGWGFIPASPRATAAREASLT